MHFRLRYCLIFLFTPAIVLAHGLVTTQTQTVGNYKIEFEYNTLGSIFGGDYVIYDTYLLRPSDNQPLDFDSAFIRIQKKNGLPALAGSLNESSDIRGYASLSGVINDPGIYTAEVDFYQFGKNLTTAQFDFEVKAPNALLASKPAQSGILLSVGMFFIGFAIGAGGILWLKSQKKI